MRVVALLFLFLIVAVLAACSPSTGPPAIPHPVTSQECVRCHREGKEGAPKMNHPARGTCSSCHKPA
ncbi:MAG: hypothetical protein HY675_27495 [Chloroflexi bacterium]|nr:hypothetical protein [Chloroflexota bacterium]